MSFLIEKFEQNVFNTEIYVVNTLTHLIIFYQVLYEWDIIKISRVYNFFNKIKIFIILNRLMVKNK